MPRGLLTRNNRFLRRQAFARRKAIGPTAAGPSPVKANPQVDEIADKLRALGLPAGQVSTFILALKTFASKNGGNLNQSTVESINRVISTNTGGAAGLFNQLNAIIGIAQSAAPTTTAPSTAPTQAPL